MVLFMMTLPNLKSRSSTEIQNYNYTLSSLIIGEVSY